MIRKDELIETIRAAFAREQPANLEEAQAIFARLQAEHNHTPLEDFDGLSPAQTAGLLYSPFEVPALATLPRQYRPMPRRRYWNCTGAFPRPSGMPA